MSYIRTKEGIYELKDNGKYGDLIKTIGLDNFLSQNYKQSDNLAELCDEFVFEMGLEHTICQLTFEQVRDNILNCELESMSTLYGAIWTDKGLIYVAKMNEKGELCLI